MATDLKTESTTSVTSLVSGIVQDAQELVKQQLELFKSELRADVHNAKIAFVMLSVAGGVALVGAVLVGAALALLLQAVAPELPLWACSAICGGVLLAIGAALCAGGWHKLHAVHPLPEQTVEALKENLQWKMTPK